MDFAFAYCMTVHLTEDYLRLLTHSISRFQKVQNPAGVRLFRTRLSNMTAAQSSCRGVSGRDRSFWIGMAKTFLLRDRNLGGLDELSNLRALCSTCNQGAKNITGEKPSAIWLLSQVRRAGLDEQRAVFDWLRKKFGA